MSAKSGTSSGGKVLSYNSPGDPDTQAAVDTSERQAANYPSPAEQDQSSNFWKDFSGDKPLEVTVPSTQPSSSWSVGGILKSLADYTGATPEGDMGSF